MIKYVNKQIPCEHLVLCSTKRFINPGSVSHKRYTLNSIIKRRGTCIPIERYTQHSILTEGDNTPLYTSTVDGELVGDLLYEMFLMVEVVFHAG